VVQKKNSDSAIVVDNATLYWTDPASQQACNNTDNQMATVDQDEKNDLLPALRNISFTLPMVTCETSPLCLLRAFLLSEASQTTWFLAEG